MAAGPFLVKLFYRTGAFHRTDEFSAAHQLPFVPAHVFSSCTLTQLAHVLAASQDPVVLPSPVVGTRIAFRLVHVNDESARGEDGSSTAGGLSGLPRIVVKDLGSVVIGGGGLGAPTSLASLEALDKYDFEDVDFAWKTDTGGDNNDDASHTLADAHFAVGDGISCAIMPPLANGCVVAASDIRSGRGAGIGAATAATACPPPSPPRRWKGGGGGGGGGDGSSRFGRRAYPYRAGAGGPPSPGAVPTGEWRRGDTLPTTGDWVRDGGRVSKPSSNRRRNGR